MRFPPILMVSERVSGGRILQVENSHLRGVRCMHATRLVCLHVEYAGFNVFLSSFDAICVFILNTQNNGLFGRVRGGRILQVQNSHLRGLRCMHATQVVYFHVLYAGFNVFLSISDAICVFLLNPMIMATLGGSEGGGYWR